MKNTLVIFRKDLEEIRKVRYVYFSLLFVPIALVAVATITFYGISRETDVTPEKVALLRLAVPGSDGMSPKEVLMHFWANQWMTYLLLIPAALPTVIASYSIIGEKLQKTLEPLLATPADDTEILLGKSLASAGPALVAAYLAFIVYSVGVDVIAYPVLGYILFPNWTWGLAMLLIAPTLSFLGVMLCVLISSKVNDVRAAQQIAVVVVLPIIALFIAQMAGVFIFNLNAVLAGFLLLLALDYLLFRVGKRIFERENILTRWK